MASIVDVQPVEVAAPPAPAAAPAQNSLYVGDLDKDVLEEQLYGIFAAIGQVASVRVCRDAVTRRSLGYAYVNYNGALDPGAATRAMDQLNFSMVAGKPIRIMWSQRDPSARKSAVGNIFIKNLDKSIDNKSLHDTFVDFGKILSCKVATDASGQSHGYGFVHFESEESAERSIALVNGKVIENKIVTVCPFLKRNERPAGKDLFTNVYIKNLPTEVDTDDAFLALVKEFGESSSAVITKDDKLVSKGFGFVNFKEPESAAACVEALNGKDVGGKVLFASKAQKKVEREAALKQKADEVKKERIAKFEGMNLYVKNLADEVEDEVLREHFDGCGTIVSCKVMKDAAGKSKGFGFVCFTSNDEAVRGVNERSGKMFKGKPLYVALAQRKDVRKQQQERAVSDLRVDNMTRPNPMNAPSFAGAMPYYAGGPMNSGPRPNYGFNGMAPMGVRPNMAGPQPGPGGRGGRGPAPMQMGPQFGAPPNMQMQQQGGRGGRGARGGRGQMGMENQGQFQQMPPQMMGPYGNMPPGFNPMYQQQMMQMNQYPQQMMMQPQQMMMQQQPQQQMQQQQGPPMQQQQQMMPGGPGSNGFNGNQNQQNNNGNQNQGGRGGRGGRGGGAAAPKQAGQAGGRGGRGSAPPPPPAPASAQAPGAPAVAGAADLASAPLSTSVLVQASPEQQKQLIGERLYPEVSKLQPELAGKITGMLLEMDNQELLLLLEDEVALKAKVDEAINVLKQHNITAEGEAVATTEA